MSETQFWQALPTTEFPIAESLRMSQDLLLRYAWASGDYNQIHYSQTIAQNMGLPGIIAHGMLSQAFMVKCAFEQSQKLLGEDLKNPKVRIASVDTKFVAMVAVGDQVSICAKVHSQSEDSATLLIHMFKTGNRESVVCSGQLLLKKIT